MSNIFGKNLTITTFGESHGPGLGVVLDGLPAGILIDQEAIQLDLDRRRPGQSKYTTKRNEADQVEILSGITANGLSNGAPMALLIRNHDARSQDYGRLSDKFRPGHADYTYYQKYNIPPQPGGGRSSGRETAARVAAGAVAKQLLKPTGIKIQAYTIAIGTIIAQEIQPDFAESNPLRFADPNLLEEAQNLLKQSQRAGDSLGAIVEVKAENVPVGLGKPAFDKLDARLGAAFFSIGAVKAVEIGEGIKSSLLKGSENNDAIRPEGFVTNRHGGILGGISSGAPILAKIYVKPTSSIGLRQDTININGEAVDIRVSGRHDPCLGPRLAVVAEAMMALTLADFYLSSIDHV